MPPKRRKVQYFELRAYEVTSRGNEISAWDELLAAINEIENTDFAARKFDHLNSYYTRFYKSQVEGNYVKLIFITARNGYRAPLQDKDTGGRRENPKELTEGEEMLTHVVIKREYTGNNISARLYLSGCIETGKGNITLKNLEAYLNRFLPSNRTSRFEVHFMFHDNFLQELRKADRVAEMEIDVAKEYISHDFGIPERREVLKEHITLKLVPRRGLGRIMKNFTIDTIQGVYSQEVRIKAVRVRALDQGNNVFKLNTSKLMKVTFVNAYADDNTGQITSESILPEMEAVVHNL